MSDNPGAKPRFRFGGLDAAAVAKAEAALKTLSVNFEQWMQEELARLVAARDLVRAEGYNTNTAKNLYHRAHDIKGLGTTYGYPLVTRIATSLCELLHDPATRMSAPPALIEEHVDAIVTVVRGDIRSEENLAGRSLAESLEAKAAPVISAAAA